MWAYLSLYCWLFWYISAIGVFIFQWLIITSVDTYNNHTKPVCLCPQMILCEFYFSWSMFVQVFVGKHAIRVYHMCVNVLSVYFPDFECMFVFVCTCPQRWCRRGFLGSHPSFPSPHHTGLQCPQWSVALLWWHWAHFRMGKWCIHLQRCCHTLPILPFSRATRQLR